MITATFILILSTALFLFYLQSVCQKILRRKFAQVFWQAIATANGFEFPSVRQALESSGAPMQFPRLMMALRCDFQALTYLAKNAANVNQRHNTEERFLILYFKWASLSLVVRHWLKLREQPAALKMTAILQYFANVVGERANTIRLGNLTTSDYLLNL